MRFISSSEYARSFSGDWLAEATCECFSKSSMSKRSLCELFNKTEVFYVPYVGTSFSLYDGSEWILHDFFPFISKSVNDLDFYGDPIDAETSYDVYAALHNGLPILEFEPWTSIGINSDTRTVDPVYFEGVLVKGNDSTRRYLGMVRTTAATAIEFEDSNTHLFVWNALNQVDRVANLSETAVGGITHTSTYSSDWHLATGSQLGFTEFINGIHVKVRCDAVAGGKSTGGRNNEVAIIVRLDNVTTGISVGEDLPYAGNSTPMWSCSDYYIAPNYHNFKIVMAAFGNPMTNSIIFGATGPDSGPDIARSGMSVVITG